MRARTARSDSRDPNARSGGQAKALGCSWPLLPPAATTSRSASAHTVRASGGSETYGADPERADAEGRADQNICSSQLSHHPVSEVSKSARRADSRARHRGVLGLMVDAGAGAAGNGARTLLDEHHFDAVPGTDGDVAERAAALDLVDDQAGGGVADLDDLACLEAR